MYMYMKSLGSRHPRCVLEVKPLGGSTTDPECHLNIIWCRHRTALFAYQKSQNLFIVKDTSIINSYSHELFSALFTSPSSVLGVNTRQQVPKIAAFRLVEIRISTNRKVAIFAPCSEMATMTWQKICPQWSVHLAAVQLTDEQWFKSIITLRPRVNLRPRWLMMWRDPVLK